MLDVNGDGEISAAELAKAEEALRRLDRNRDGRLTGEEIFPRPPGGPDGFGRPSGFGEPGPNRAEQKLTDIFDTDGNGYLDPAERELALQAVDAGGGGRPPRRRPGGGDRLPGSPGPKVAVKDAKVFPDAKLYDRAVLRTLFIEFDTDEWEAEMAKFKHTDVEMPATVTMDGMRYPLVGIKFRGQSSFGHVSAGSKRSLNLSMDFVNRDQRLRGYKTLNLLNGMGDPSFLSSILYSQLATDFLPAPRANIAKAVINGESWGLYANVQQFNKDFVKDFFGTSAGARWKVSGSPQADGGLRYLGEELAPYRQRFEIKSKDSNKSWQALIALCKVLQETPIEKLPAAIEPILNVDGALRFLALDVITANSDGYWVRASDYSIYRDPNGVFHILPHDMNEAFRGPRPPRGGGGGGGGFPGRPPRGGRGGHGGPELDPLVGIDNPRMPLRSKLLAVPEYRTRYLQYVRTIAETTLTHKNLSPVIAQYRALMSDEVKIDTRKMSSHEAFLRTTAPLDENGQAEPGSINEFIAQRREYLLGHDAVKAVKPIEIAPYRKPTAPVKQDVSLKVAFSEILAANTQTNRDPQGEFADWIELVNYGKAKEDLSGMFLSDDPRNAAKWKFPAGTIIEPGGRLIIWADEDTDAEGLHANFKLAKSGETLTLTSGLGEVDRLSFGPQRADVAFGRLSMRSEKPTHLTPTPGKANVILK